MNHKPLDPAYKLLTELMEAEGLGPWFLVRAGNHPDEEDRYRQSLADGFQAGMTWLENHASLKYNPESLLPGVQTIVFACLNYYQERRDFRGEGVVARYAWGRDYHRVLGDKLKKIQKKLQSAFPEEGFRSFTDTSPLDERFWAALAGAGTRGRHGLVITRDWGSWVVLGEILTTLDWAKGSFQGSPQPGLGCPSGCRKCWEACPTGALGEKGLDARLCLSYHTIENQGALPVALRVQAGARIFGCDVCQEVCPLNIKAEKTSVSDFLNPKAGSEISLGEILGLESEGEFTKKFAGSPVHRAGIVGMQRNACHAAANLGRKDLIPHIMKLVHSPDEGLAESASWALTILTRL